MSASEYLPLYQSFTNRTHIRKGRRFDQSEISQIVEKNICCGVILFWFDTIKKYTSRRIYRVIVQYETAYIVDIVGWLNFGLPKGSRIPRPPCNMLQSELGSEAQWSKRLLRSIFYRWYDQWTLSKLVKVQQSSKWGKFNSAQIKAVGGRSSPRFEGCTKLCIVHDDFLWCHASYDGQFCGISLFCDKLLLTRINLMLVISWKSRRSALRSWQMTDFHNTARIIRSISRFIVLFSRLMTIWH